jgi:hypothetical protein
MSDKTLAEAADELDAALSTARRDLIAALPPRVVRLFWRGARISASLTPRWPAWIRASLGVFAMLNGILLSHVPGSDGFGVVGGLFGLWLFMGSLRDTGERAG